MNEQPGVDLVLKWLTEIFTRQIKSMVSPDRISLLLWLVGDIVLLALWFTRLRSNKWQQDNRIRNGLLAVFSLGAVVYAYQLFWLCDDAFISFRYARNLVQGHGLVWNPGEKVEGYTDFLWTVLIAGEMKLGLDPAIGAGFTGLLSFVAALVITDKVVRLLRKDGTGGVPLAVLLFAGNYAAACFGSSGLETMFAAALITGALYCALTNRAIVAGILAAMATMAHPDHILFAVSLGIVWITSRHKPKALIYAAAFTLLFGPYFLWRYKYYGELYPNTYYAKSGGDAYWSQGIIYLAVNLLGAGIWGAVPLAVVGIWRRRSDFFGRYATIALVVYLGYVAKIGGDFMFGRLLISAMPLLLIAAELGLRDIIRKRPIATLALASTLPALVLPLTMIKMHEKAWFVADERTFYNDPAMSKFTGRSAYATWGRVLGRHLGALNPLPHIAIQSVGMVGYYSGLEILDTFGLTDHEVARIPIAHRSRPGHEKKASAGLLLRRGVEVSEVEIYPEPYNTMSKIEFEGIKLYMPRYSKRLIELSRKEKRVKLGEYRKLLDSPAPSDQAQADCDLWFMETFYFDTTDDPVRKKQWAEVYENLGWFDADSSALFLSTKGWSKKTIFDFNNGRLDGWVRTGQAFAQGITFTAPPAQSPPSGVSGGFLDSFVPKHADGATGTITSPPFVIQGDVIELSVGGGMVADKLTVALIIDGKRVKTTTGCQWDVTGKRRWGVSNYKGKKAFLEVTDDLSAQWGHILVDDVVQWTKPASEKVQP